MSATATRRRCCACPREDQLNDRKRRSRPAPPARTRTCRRMPSSDPAASMHAEDHCGRLQELDYDPLQRAGKRAVAAVGNGRCQCAPDQGRRAERHSLAPADLRLEAAYVAARACLAMALCRLVSTGSRGPATTTTAAADFMWMGAPISTVPWPQLRRKGVQQRRACRLHGGSSSAQTADVYATRANIKFCSGPQRTAAAKQKLVEGRGDRPLFDTPTLVRALELPLLLDVGLTSRPATCPGPTSTNLDTYHSVGTALGARGRTPGSPTRPTPSATRKRLDLWHANFLMSTDGSGVARTNNTSSGGPPMPGRSPGSAHSK